MNEDTRVAVCCYAGDQHQVIKSLGVYLHHECPVVILSPEDSPANIIYPGIENRFGGKRAYIGQASLDRQLAHLKLLLTFPENHFLIHDSDSVCLDPKIPDYLYAEPNIVWSNQVNDGIPEHQPYFPEGWPHVAFQPPYFLSRKTIEAMIAVSGDPRVAASPCMPFIDFYMVQLTMVAALPWRRMLDALSFGIVLDGDKNPNFNLAMNAVRNEGANILHSVKDAEIVRRLRDARELWHADHPQTPPRFVRPPNIGRG